MKALIRMYTCDAVVLTTGEYEQLEKEVRGRVLAGDPGISDLICARLLEEHRPRYFEAKHINELEVGDKND